MEQEMLGQVKERIKPLLCQDDEETDIGDLIHRLDEDVDMEPGVQLDLVAGSIVSSQFLDADPAVTAFKAVQDILGIVQYRIF